MSHPIEGVPQRGSASDPGYQQRGSWVRSAVVMLVVASASCLMTAIGFQVGHETRGQSDDPTFSAIAEPLLAASAAASDTMAVATGPVSKDAEGIFFLDFITGDLQCLVYYPRSRGFGAHYVTNVTPHLGAGGKNAQFIMVTGGAVTSASTGGAQPGASLVYVTDAASGRFAAFAVPWDRNAESSGRTQTGKLFYVGGGPVRNFQLQNNPGQNPPGIIDPNANP